jgi:hypothetical protein
MNTKRDRRCGVVSLTVGLLLLVFCGCGKKNCTDECSQDSDCYGGLVCRDACITTDLYVGTPPPCTPKKQCIPKECDQCLSVNSCSFSEAIGTGPGDSDSCSAGTCQ